MLKIPKVNPFFYIQLKILNKFIMERWVNSVYTSIKKLTKFKSKRKD